MNTSRSEVVCDPIKRLEDAIIEAIAEEITEKIAVSSNEGLKADIADEDDDTNLSSEVEYDHMRVKIMEFVTRNMNEEMKGTMTEALKNTDLVSEAMIDAADIMGEAFETMTDDERIRLYDDIDKDMKLMELFDDEKPDDNKKKRKKKKKNKK